MSQWKSRLYSGSCANQGGRSGLGMGYSTARRGVEGFTDKGNRERGVTGHSGWEREKTGGQLTRG